MGGCLLAFVKRSRSLILASVFPIIYFGFISIMYVHTNQTIAPLVPFLHILGTWFLVEAIRSVLKFSLPYKYVALVLLFSYIISSYTYVGITLSKWLDSIVTINSRETSRLWIEKNIPSGSRIALEPYSPNIPPNVYNLFPIARIIDHPLEWYKESKIEYVIFSQGMYKRYFNEPAKYSEYVKQYRAFFQTFRIVKIFNDGNYEIRIYTP